MKIKIDFTKYPDNATKIGSIDESVSNWLEAINNVRNLSPVNQSFVPVGNIKVAAVSERSGNQRPAVYNINVPQEKLRVNKIDQSNDMANWLESQLSRHTLRDYSEGANEKDDVKGARFMEDTAQEFENKAYLVLRNVVLIPSANPDRKIESEESEEATFASQIDILAWDGDCLWIVECKNSNNAAVSAKIPKIAKQVGKQQALLQSFLDFIQRRFNLHSLPPVKPWLVNRRTPTHPCPWGDVHQHFPTCIEIPPVQPKPQPPPFWEILRGLCPDKALTFRERIDFVALVRDFRTRSLCLSTLRGIGSTADAPRRQITGCAGAGKSVLLCFHAWQLSVNKAVSGGELKGELKQAYQAIKSIYLIAPEPIHVQVLKEIMGSIRGQGLFSGAEGNPIHFMTVAEFLASAPIGKYAVCLDEAQELDKDRLEAINTKVSENLLIYALDRLQAIKKDGNEVKKILTEKVKGFNAINLSIQYRQPVPLYFASIALAYRWNSAVGDIYLQPSAESKGGPAKDMLVDIWGIYNCYKCEVKENETTVKKDLNKAFSPYWSNKINQVEIKNLVKNQEFFNITGNQIDNGRADHNDPINVKANYRLSLRCDVHPASYWLTRHGSCYGLRFVVDDTLDALAPRVQTGPLPESNDKLAIYRPYGREGAEVLWVKFCSDANTVTLRANTLQLVVPAEMAAEVAYAAISSQIKGREWPVVVVEGEPSDYSRESGPERIVASQLMYLIASRATVALYLIGEGPSREEFLRLDAKQADANGTIYNPAFPGYIIGEFDKNIGLRWGKQPSEPCVWWHLSWKNPDVNRVKKLFGLNPPSDENQDDQQEQRT